MVLNPNYWSDVRKYLPLLKVKKFYKKTKYGYARGNEPVKYVARIQAYLNVIYDDRKITFSRRLALKKSLIIKAHSFSRIPPKNSGV